MSRFSIGKRVGFAAVMAAMLWACVGTAGRDFDTTHVHDVKAGQQKAQIKSWFGDPVQTVTMTATSKGCVERWIYKYGRSAGGVTTARALLVDFDGGGSVCDTSYAEQGPQ